MHDFRDMSALNEGRHANGFILDTNGPTISMGRFGHRDNRPRNFLRFSLDKVFRKRPKDFRPVRGNEHIIFNSKTTDGIFVNAGFDGS